MNKLTIQLCIFLFIYFLRAASPAYGNSQAKVWIRATAASLCHNHSNTRSELPLRTTPQLRAMLDPLPTGPGQRSNLHSLGYLLGSLLMSHHGNSLLCVYVNVIWQNLFFWAWKGEKQILNVFALVPEWQEVFFNAIYFSLTLQVMV